MKDYEELNQKMKKFFREKQATQAEPTSWESGVVEGGMSATSEAVGKYKSINYKRKNDEISVESLWQIQPVIKNKYF